MVDKGVGKPPGAHHYRAFVGPAKDYDLLGGLQLALLFVLGLREHHTLCDVGCGSLRAGRMLLSYLDPGGYHGLEPEAWTVKEAIGEELGQDFVDRRRPNFRFAADYGVSHFGTEFDFVLAQSILSHTYVDDAATLFAEIGSALAPDGVLVATYYPVRPDSRHPLPLGSEGQGWRYPGNVAYHWEEIAQLAAANGLEAAPLDWPHPRQRWFLATPAGGEPDAAARSAAVRAPVDTWGATP